jgi:DNA replicative helicase MCM subunit Mcm2 (Cdc46/Mcm family)
MLMPCISHQSNKVARLAQRKSLKPGDRVSLTGVVRVDTIEFPRGETQTIHRIALTSAPEMVAKEKRVSTTVFAQKRTQRNS